MLSFIVISPCEPGGGANPPCNTIGGVDGCAGGVVTGRFVDGGVVDGGVVGAGAGDDGAGELGGVGVFAPPPLFPLLLPLLLLLPLPLPPPPLDDEPEEFEA